MGAKRPQPPGSTVADPPAADRVSLDEHDGPDRRDGRYISLAREHAADAKAVKAPPPPGERPPALHTSPPQRNRSTSRPRTHLRIDGHRWRDTADDFVEWLADRDDDGGEKSPRFTRRRAAYRFARAADVERSCIRDYNNPHTVWLSLTAEPKAESGEWVDPLNHDDGFRSNAIRQSLYRVRREYDHAGVWMHAPRRSWYSHRHVALWLDGEVTESDFHSVVDSHVRNHPAAKGEQHPYDDAVKVRKVTSDDLSRAVDGLDVEIELSRGCTTALPREIGGNLPALACDWDLRDGPTPARMWAAAMWQNHNRKGRRIWSPVGDFSERADAMHRRRGDNPTSGSPDI